MGEKKGTGAEKIKKPEQISRVLETASNNALDETSNKLSNRTSTKLSNGTSKKLSNGTTKQTNKISNGALNGPEIKKVR